MNEVHKKKSAPTTCRRAKARGRNLIGGAVMNEVHKKNRRRRRAAERRRGGETL